MFDKAIVPIILYGVEGWGFINFDLNERVHLQLTFVKNLR